MSPKVRRRVISRGGSPSRPSEIETKLRIRSMLPIELAYDPFDPVDNVQRFLKDLLSWLLAGKLNHRTVTAARGVIETFLHAANLPEVERRMEEIEAQYQLLRARYPDAFKPSDQVIKDSVPMQLIEEPKSVKTLMDEIRKEAEEKKQNATT
jgi:hypothetical protein